MDICDPKWFEPKPQSSCLFSSVLNPQQVRIRFSPRLGFLVLLLAGVQRHRTARGLQVTMNAGCWPRYMSRVAFRSLCLSLCITCCIRCRLLAKWAESKRALRAESKTGDAGVEGGVEASGSFAFTSNIDGHWLRVLQDAQVLECHGAVTHLQPLQRRRQKLDPSTATYWPAQDDVMLRMRLPRWSVTAGDVVEVALDCPDGVPSSACQWHSATIAQDCCSIDPSSIPPNARVCGVRPIGGHDMCRCPSSPTTAQHQSHPQPQPHAGFRAFFQLVQTVVPPAPMCTCLAISTCSGSVCSSRCEC
jgi:hypothetical protein